MQEEIDRKSSHSCLCCADASHPSRLCQGSVVGRLPTSNDLDSSSNSSFSPLLTSPSPNTLTLTPLYWNWGKRERRHVVCQGTGFLWPPRTLAGCQSQRHSFRGKGNRGLTGLLSWGTPGELMEKELLLSDRFMHLTPGLTSLSVIQMLLYRLVIF